MDFVPSLSPFGSSSFVNSSLPRTIGQRENEIYIRVRGMEGRDKERDRTVVVKGPQETKLAALGRFGSVQPAVALALCRATTTTFLFDYNPN